MAAVWNNPKYAGAIADCSAKNPISADAMLFGWHFGDKVDAKGRAAREAVYRLLSHRLNVRTLGEAVGYTLNYLQGYEESTAAAQPDIKNSDILAQLQQTLVDQAGAIAGTNTEFRDANDKFFSAIAAALRASADSSTKAKAKAAARGKDNLRELLVGFNQGSLRSAEVVYADVFLLAYGRGYSDGFSNGYSAGYAEGYKSGKASRGGFWGEVNHFLDDVNDITKNVRGIADDVTKVADDVAKVVEVLGGLF
jgi:hypothetical protein